jgi:hypothetical protein
MTSNKKEVKSGQIEEQLDSQANAASSKQQQSETDQEVVSTANDEDSELDEIIT